MRFLNGSELASYIKERQAKQVRRLRQQYHIQPKLAIIATVDNPAIATYLRLKQRYGEDILIDVDVYNVKQSEVPDLINKLNQDPSVYGIIVQLPLADPAETDGIVNLVDPAKDVDGLGKNHILSPATPKAILWLLSGYNIDLVGKNVLLVGLGKLVGAPLKQLLIESNLHPNTADRKTADLKAETLQADILITATGSAGLIKPDMIKPKAVVVDAGTASESGNIVGDVDPKVYERDDLTITPVKGGVGPLTVCALFDNVILAAEATIKAD